MVKLDLFKKPHFLTEEEQLKARQEFLKMDFVAEYLKQREEASKKIEEFQKSVELGNQGKPYEVKEGNFSKQSNPFKELDYRTNHLSHFDDMNNILGLYGKHYSIIKKARWYQALGGIIQKKIKLGDKHTDTRINCIFPLPTEQGKNDLIYLFKSVISKVIKDNKENYVIEEPISYHPEQLVGKIIEVFIDNPNGLKPKKIKVKQENRGYFNSDFIEIDEANLLFFSKEEQIKQAREYISKALNPIDRNEIVKKLVDDLPTDRVSYCPKCTMTLYFQPKKLEEELVLQGFLRRFLIPVGNIEPFLNYGNTEDFNMKIKNTEIPKQQLKENLISYFDKINQTLKNKDFVFTEEARDKLNFYLDYLITEGKVHSDKISKYVKLFKWTIQDYLIKMSCIIAGSFYQNIITEKHLSLAYMDLVELLQAHFNFINEWIIGSFDYGVSWKGANYNERQCLEYLFNEDCLSFESSQISIFEFEKYITDVYQVKNDRATQIYRNFKKKGWIDSKQKGQSDSRVWITFTPELENLIIEGDKGDKGFILYKSIVSSINDILGDILPLSPFIPLKEKLSEEKIK